MNNPIIEVAVGLVFFYVFLSLIVSSVQEFVASYFATRAKNLYEGIQNFVGEEYARKIYEHPMLRNLSKGERKPSYIDTRILSTVLLNIVAREKKEKLLSECSPDEVRDMADKIEYGHPLHGILDTLLDETGKNASAPQDRLAEWFDEGMMRISGWYRRKMKWRTCLIALIFTAGLNANTIDIAKRLWENATASPVFAVQMDYEAHEGSPNKEDGKISGYLKNPRSFPVGWVCPPKSGGGGSETESGENKQRWWSCLPQGAVEWIKTLFGWFLTVAAVSLGAPFWFDLLGKVVNLRSSGEVSQHKKNQSGN